MQGFFNQNLPEAMEDCELSIKQLKDIVSHGMILTENGGEFQSLCPEKQKNRSPNIWVRKFVTCKIV